MTRPVTIITDEPIIEVVAEMKLDEPGVLAMAEWVKRYRPGCVPEGGFSSVLDLVPHDGHEDYGNPPGQVDTFGNPLWSGSPLVRRRITDNELLCELAGRKCYDSFAEKGAKRTNGEYLRSMWTVDDEINTALTARGARPKNRVPHRSTGYHAKMTFFMAHVSRRFSHEYMRNYIGSDRNEEGSPSQESTRFTEHPGVYICHPRDLAADERVRMFKLEAQLNYDGYLSYIGMSVRDHQDSFGAKPKGMDRKRIYEAASGRLLQACATSFIWTTNPMALAKFFGERCDEASDLEMQRFAKKLRRVCLARWPNLFPGIKAE